MAIPKEASISRNASKNNLDFKASPMEGKKLTQHLAAVIVNLAGFTTGTIIGWTSPMIPILQTEYSPLQNGTISNGEASWMGSLMCLGALLATPFYLYLTHHLSRKLTGYLVAVPFLISWLFVIFAESIPLLYIARFIGGVGCGAATVFPPIYVSEIVEDSVRGTLGSYLILFTNAGVLFAFVVGSFVSYYTFAYLLMLFPIVYLICYIWLPETPVYLINKGRNGDAERNLRWLRGKNEEVIQNELAKTVSFIKQRRTIHETAGLKDILTSVGSRRALIIGIVLASNMQLCGIFAVLSYAVNIFQEAGSDLSPYVSSIIVGSLQLAGSYVSTLLIDKAGRKILLFISNASMAICLGALGTYFFLKYIGSDVSSIGWLPVTSLSVFIFSLALGLAPVTFVIISEVFEPQVKGKATTIIISIMWFLSFIIAKFYPNMSDLIGIHGCYWLFSACCVLGTIYSLIAVPETKNRSYESILQELGGNKHVKRTNNIQKEAEHL